MTDAVAHPLAEADADSLTALFDADPMQLDDASFDRLVAEFRRRADVHAAEEAKSKAAPKAAAKPVRVKTKGVAQAARSDKPLAEVSLADLMKGTQ